jgi:putative chitinase
MKFLRRIFMSRPLISGNQIAAILPKCREPNAWAESLYRILPAYDIKTPQRIAAFVSQCAHESSEFNMLVENLSYSSNALRKVFGKYYKEGSNLHLVHHRQPILIANTVYANRMGNGDFDSGDGWRYRGGGLIQLTGKSNYTACAIDLGIPLEELAGLIRDPDNKDLIVQVACWFWQKNNLNRWSDSEDQYRELTRRINGGFNGLDDRLSKYKKAIEVLV